MKFLVILSTATLAVAPLAGCSIQEVATTAADAAACKALSSTLDGISTAYSEGLIDSGVLQQVDDMVGQQVAKQR